MDRGPQRRLLARRLRPALRAAPDGPGVRLPGRQRRGPAAHADVVPALAEALHRAAEGPPRVRLGPLRAADAEQPEDLRPRPPLRGRRRALRPQPGALGAGGAARSVSLRGALARGDVRAHALPARRRASVSPPPRAARLLLVPAPG